MKWCVVGLAVMLLSAWAAVGGDEREIRVTYDCERGPPITVVFAGNTARILDTGGGRDTVLTRRVTGSGVLYESTTRTIRRQGNQIVYTIGRTAPMTCTAVRGRPR